MAGARAKSRMRANYLWTAVRTAGANLTASAVEVPIVANTDWERSALGLEKATLVSVKGFIVINSLLLTTATWDAYIAVYDEDEVAQDPDTVATYVHEQILWTGGGSQVLGIHESARREYFEINLRTSRRITNGMKCVLVTQASTADVFQTHVILRGLVRLS